MPYPLHPHQLGMTARHQQGDKRESGRIGAQKRRQQMPLQVVHAQHRLAQRSPQRACHASTHQQGPGETRPPGEGHHIHLGQRTPGLRQDLGTKRQHASNMVATGQLRHHTAVGLVHLNLAVQGLRQQHWRLLTLRRDQCDPRFVTGRLDPEHQGIVQHSR